MQMSESPLESPHRCLFLRILVNVSGGGSDLKGGAVDIVGSIG